MSNRYKKVQKPLITAGRRLLRWIRGMRNTFVRWTLSLSLRRRILYATTAGVVLLATIIPTVQFFIESHRYKLDDSTLQLIGKANPNLAAKLTYDRQNSQWQFNKNAILAAASQSEAETPSEKDIANVLKAQVGGGGKDDESLYAINFPTDPKKGVTVYDSGTQLSFTMTPQFKMSGGQATKDGRLVYPMANGAQLIYTPKNNGMKEDIVLPKFIGEELAFSYKLDLPDSLMARIQEDGSVGVFSVDPALLGSVSTSNDMDAEKLKSAREHAEKNHLLFAIPAPVIAQTGNKPTKATAKFGLANNVLTVTAREMDTLQYPVSVDPSVVVTSSSNFQLGGNNEGSIDYSTADQISRTTTSGGTVGDWSTIATPMNMAYEKFSTIAYNGYLYRLSGATRSPAGSYANVYYAAINSNGTIGTWNTTTDLPAGYSMTQIVAYNGYMYLISDAAYINGNVNVATSYYSKINSNGTIGTWNTTTDLPQALTNHAVVATGGYIYTMGGSPTSGGNCGANNDCTNIVYYAPLNGDGTIGTWNTTSSFATVRAVASATSYNGYVYISGGGNTGYLNDVQYAHINSNGTLDSWKTATSFTNARYGHQFAAYNGYMYLWSGRGSSWYSDVQYAQIYADGSLGSWATTKSFTTGRAYGGGAIYNGYLYMLGGYNGSVNFDDVQYAKINTPGTTTSYTTSGSTFTTTRRGAQTIIYGNYIYVMGGDNGAGPNNTVYKALISSSGSIGTFTSTTAFTTARTYFAAVAYGGYMYVLGGCTSAYSGCSTNTSNIATVYRSAINQADGTLGAWSAEGSITTARYGLSAVAYNGYMYVLGGLNGSTYNNTIQYHAINASNGTMSGAWTTSSRTLPAPMAYMGSAVYAGTLYVAGGCTTDNPLTCTSTRNAVHYGTIGSSGELTGSGALVQSGAFTTNRGDFGMVAANNRLYITGGRTSTTYYNDTQSAPINNDGTVGSWVAHTDSTLATARYGIGMATTGGNIYVAGGYNGTTYYNNVQTAHLNSGGGGNADTWSTDSTDGISTARAESQTVAYNGYLYVLGGRNSGGTSLNTVEYAKINDDGTVGSWTNTSSFTTGRVTFAAAVMDGYMYVLGGRNGGSYLKDIQYALINSDGSLGTWASAGSNVFNGGQGACMVTYNGYIYSLGGWDGATDHNSVRYAATNANGTINSWQTGPNFAGTRSNGQCVAYGGYLYMMGGEDTVGKSDVQYVAINSNGSLGSWASTTSYHRGRANHTAFAYNGYMYVMGGVDSTTTNVSRNDMQYAAINANGTVGTWQHTDQLDNYGYVDAVPYNGYVYMPSQQLETTTKYTSLNTISRIGRYSKLVDLGINGKVTGIAYNGTLPGGTAQIDYRTAGNDGAFGSLLNVKRPPAPTGPCIGTYGSGRYVWVSITLDDTDGSTANLTDITVIYESYHPSAAIRLHGGKTLQSGTLSSLDTCGMYT